MVEEFGTWGMSKPQDAWQVAGKWLARGRCAGGGGL